MTRVLKMAQDGNGVACNSDLDFGCKLFNKKTIAPGVQFLIEFAGASPGQRQAAAGLAWFCV
jgi:hypothetical protein